jgi:hypothetical protein
MRTGPRKLFVTATIGVISAWTYVYPILAANNGPPVPDFSGIWVHPTLPGFEAPPSGPGPVRNLSRTRNGVGNFNQLVGDYTNPILKPQAAEIVKKHGEMSLAGVGYPTPSSQCWPGGVPYLFWNIEMQMFQRPREITILYLIDHLVRRVRMNQPHPAHVTPSLNGDSVGHYEGDVLVVDTVGIKADPFAMVDMYGTPHSAALHVVERYQLVDYETAKQAAERDEKDNLRLPDYTNDVAVAVDTDYKGKGLQLEFTVEDEGVFTTPWSGTITYRRASNEWREHVCAENMHEYYYNKNADVPTAHKPDF